jgi:hypothetical protein
MEKAAPSKAKAIRNKAKEAAEHAGLKPQDLGRWLLMQWPCVIRPEKQSEALSGKTSAASETPADSSCRPASPSWRATTLPTTASRWWITTTK